MPWRAELGATAKRAWRRFSSHEYSVVTAAFFLLTCLYTHPLVLNLTKVARSGNDYLLFLWNFWWVRDSLESLRAPFFTDYQYHPDGTSLAFHPMSYHWSLLSVPFQYLLPRQVILNSFYIVAFVATGVVTYRLLRYLKCSMGASFFGGMAFTFCAHQMDRFHYFEIHLLGTMYIPLFMYFFFRIYDASAEGERHGLAKLGAGAGIAVALTALCSWYIGFFLVAFSAFAFVYKSFACRKLPLRALLAMVLVAGVLIGPFVQPMVAARLAGVYPSRSYESTLESAANNNADLLGYLVPNGAEPGVGLAALKVLGFDAPLRWARKTTSSYFGNYAEKSVFPGYTVMLLAVLSVWSLSRMGDAKTRGFLVFLYVTAASFVALSFGPTLYVHGEPTFTHMPYRLLMKVPLLDVSRVPSRFGLIAMFCLAIVAGVTLDHLKKLAKGRSAGRLLLVIVFAAVVAETLPARPHPLRPIEEVESELFHRLRGLGKGRSALLNVPVDFFGAKGAGGLYLFHQTIHHQKIVGGYLGREPVRVLARLEGSPFLKALHHRRYETDKRISLDGISDAEVKKSLRDLDVDYVVLYKAHLGPNLAGIRERFRSLFGESVYEDRLVEVFAAGEGG